jgi:hypothetical protein
MVKVDPQTGEIIFHLQYTTPAGQVGPVDQHLFQLNADYVAVSSWLQGFFTGANLYYPKAQGNLTKGTKPRAWMVWLFSYCQSHPTDDVVGAAVALTNAFAAQP